MQPARAQENSFDAPYELMRLVSLAGVEFNSDDWRRTLSGILESISERIFTLRHVLRQDDPIRFLAKTLSSRRYIAKTMVHSRGTIKGIRNITVNGRLRVGIDGPGFMNSSDRTFLHIIGKLQVEGDVSISRGSRLDVCEGAVCILDGCSISGPSVLVVRHRVVIGAGSIISWGCHFMDSDWHTIDYDGKMDRDPDIVIGKHVWVGHHVLIGKGVRLGDGVVVAAGSVVTRSFPPGVLIGGNPASVIREHVVWA
jgi:acetyltransferase-like isoleucine patch superfamily enzyme